MRKESYLVKAMKFDRTYEKLGERLGSNRRQLRLLHSVLGMSGEVGETVDTVKKNVLYNKELDVENLKEECGDILWYMAIMLDEIGSNFDEVMQMNIDKLSKRYPEGFTEKNAQLRLDKQGEEK